MDILKRRMSFLGYFAGFAVFTLGFVSPLAWVLLIPMIIFVYSFDHTRPMSAGMVAAMVALLIYGAVYFAASSLTG